MLIKTYLTAFLTFIINIQYSKSEFVGEMTSYGASEENQFCGFKRDSWNYNNMMTAAINIHMIDNSLSCGLCANVKYKEKIETVLVDNLCPECKFGDLDLSNQAWQRLTGNSNYGREKITWEFVSCDKFIKKENSEQGGLVLRPHHINYWWLAMTPSNMKCGVSDMFISFKGNPDWVRMERNNNAMNGLYFIYHKHIQEEFKFKVLSKYGEELETDWYKEIKEVFYVGKQFKCEEMEDCGEYSAQSPAANEPHNNNSPGSLRGSCTCAN